MIAVSREQAITAGVGLYWRGKPCALGHVAPFQVSNYTCTECARLKQLNGYRSLSPTERKERNSGEYAKNRDSIRECQRHYYQTKGKTAAIARASDWAISNPEKVRASKRSYKCRNPAVYLALDAARRARKAKAMPKWADKDAIRGVYQAAREATQLTGVLHAVDHIIPLFGRRVCGLHVHTNLQVLTFSENCIKSNKFIEVHP